MTEQKSPEHGRLAREKKIIGQMIELYCRKNHKSKGYLCEDCKAMMDYASERLDRCPFGENKPACSKCTVHCYRPRYRERVRSIMRFSGPRMLLYHPVFLISHYLDYFRFPPNPARN